MSFEPFPRDIAEHRFVIPGACPPKGSRVPVGKNRRATRESSKRVKPWIDAAVRSFLTKADGTPRARFEGPVYVGAEFSFRRPKVTELPYPTAPSIGDLDKLMRTVFDALTQAKVIEDDRFVVAGLPPRKLWGDENLTIIRVGHMKSISSRVLENSFWCSACSITDPHTHELIDVSPNPYRREVVTGRPVFAEPSLNRPPERCLRDCAPVPHYHEPDGSWMCWCLRAGCQGCVPPS